MTGLLGAAVLGLGALGLAAVAGAHDNANWSGPGIVHACVGRYGGVRVLSDPNAACVSGETPFHWKGGPARFVDLGLTVLDIKTGLEWEKKTGAGAGADPNNLHDLDNTYKWCVVTGITVGLACSSNTSSWIAAVNQGNGFAGHNDWRVPTKDELLTILDTPTPGTGNGCSHNPCIDPIFGPTNSSHYWSATEFAVSSPGLAWGVLFDAGLAHDFSKLNLFSVRAVRSGP
jgi:hypothetical protein